MFSQSAKPHPGASQSGAQECEECPAGGPALIVAMVATFNRPREIARLLESLAAHRNVLTRVLVVDNGGGGLLDEILAPWGEWVLKLDPNTNLGCGGGLNYAYKEARGKVPNATHFLVLDDDAVVPPGTLDALLAAMNKAGADLSTPLILGPDRKLGWTPGLFERKIHRHAQRLKEPAEFLHDFGSQPVPFLCACGVCLLLTRRAMEESGPHREDFWVRGEDFEFSLRHTRRRRGILVPTLTVDHLPPSTREPMSDAAEFLKHSALIQNICYLTCRLPHGRRLCWTIPGALKHYLKTWGFRGAIDACRAVWAGVVLGYPAGRGSGETFFRRFCKLPPSLSTPGDLR